MKKPEKKKFLDKEEFKKLLDLAKEISKRDYVLFFLAGNLGLRVGEVVRLRKEDFDFSNNIIRIPTLKQKRKGQIGKRELPEVYIELSSDAVMNNEVFRKHFDKCYRWIFEAKNTNFHIMENTAQKIFKRYMRVLDWKETFHSLRHFRGDSVYKETLDLMSVSKVLRHKSLKYARAYVHPGIKEIRKYIEMGGVVE